MLGGGGLAVLLSRVDGVVSCPLKMDETHYHEVMTVYIELLHACYYPCHGNAIQCTYM